MNRKYNMTLDAAIRKIIKKIKPNDYFDTHSIINDMLKDFELHQSYLSNYSNNKTVALYHSQISQAIEATRLAEKVIIADIEVKVKTHTIYGNLSENQLWRKL